MSSALIDELRALPIDDRLDLVELLWDSIAAEPDSIPLTEEQVRLIDERLDAHERNPSAGVSWEQLKADFKNRACSR